MALGRAVSATYAVTVEYPDAHSCRVTVADLPSTEHPVTLYEVRVSAEFRAEARKRALADLARFLNWSMTPRWGDE